MAIIKFDKLLKHLDSIHINPVLSFFALYASRIRRNHRTAHSGKDSPFSI